MSLDPLCRIFGQHTAPVTGVQAEAPKLPRSEPWPHFEADAKGMVTPVNFDNDMAIQVGEETLAAFNSNVGVKHPGVIATAEGLARLYEMKAGVEKDVAYYDKAIEYLQLSNKARDASMGAYARSDPKYAIVEKTVKKIERKKERRLAKAPAVEDSSMIIPASRAVEVVLAASGQFIFRYEDGSQAMFNLTENQGNSLTSFQQLDDDTNDVYSAPPFILQPGEFIVGVIANEKQTQGELNAITFHTSYGRRSHLFKFSAADPLGREYIYMATKGSHITGFEEVKGKIACPLSIKEGAKGASD